jgi:uncharacterized cupredoxin-like copper-binding protein
MRSIALALLGVVALAGAACSSHGSATAAPKPLPHAVRVAEGEMFLHPSSTKAATGSVTFTVTNHGAAHHEFVIVSGDPTGTTGEEPDRVSEANHVGGEEGPEIGDIAPGQTKTMVVQLPPGTYTAMCNLPGHYGSGMHFSFTVR